MERVEFVVEENCLRKCRNGENVLAVLVLSSAAAALAMLAKGNLVLLLSAALLFAATVLPFFAGAAIKFVV